MKRPTTPGFTLLEMLVAIMVMTLLFALVYGMLRIGSRSWESSVTSIESTDSMRIGWIFLQRALNNARTVPTKIPEGEGSHFYGDENELEFVTDLPAYLGTGGLHAIGVELEENRNTGKTELVLQRLPLIAYETDLGLDSREAQRTVLAEDVTTLQLSYYGVSGETGGDEAAWYTQWRDYNELPVLIKVRVGVDDDHDWPLLVAHPRFGGNRQEDMEPGEDDNLPELDSEEMDRRSEDEIDATAT